MLGIIQNSEVLWGRVLQLDSVSYIANNNLGVVLAQNGRSTEAIAHYRRTLPTRPSYADARNNLGYELAQPGDLTGAMAE